MKHVTTENEIQEPAVRFRPDIEWVLYADQSRWVARDPLTNAFYYFSQLEYAAAKQLDGKSTSEAILNGINRVFPGKSIDLAWLMAFVAKLKTACLLQPVGRVLANPLLRGRSNDRASLLSQFVLRPLAVRVPLLDPRPFLNWMRKPAFLLFHPIVVLFGLATSLVSGFLVLNHFLRDPESFIPSVMQIGWGWWLPILILYLLVKMLHEIGHALASVRWKANCNEIGLLFLFFTPCLYCDTTETWRLPSKWHRAAIAAAGLYVEILIAGIAALVWLNTNDGTEKLLAASVMLMCSLGTIVINGNPCFKYDGYFILSDVWGVPNLSQQSSFALWRLFIATLGGRAADPTQFDKSIWVLATYSLVSAIYRMLILVLLLWFIWTFLVLKGLGFVAILIIATTTFGLLRTVRRFVGNLFAEFFSPKPIKLARTLLLASVVGVFCLLAMAMPLPNYVRSRGVLDFHDKVALFAPQHSTILYAAEPDSQVHIGELLYEFDCPEKQLEAIQLANEISQTTRKLDLLKKASVNEPSVVYEIPTLIEVLKEFESKKSVLQPELESLRVYAPSDGFVLPSEKLAEPPLTPPTQRKLLKHISYINHRGSAMERGTLLGWFTTKNDISFQVLVSESDIKSLRIGMQAECMLDAQTRTTVRGHISRIASDPVNEVTPDILGDSWVIVERDENGKLRPIIPHYQVTVEADTNVPLAIKGANATVQIKIASSTMVELVSGYLRRTLTNRISNHNIP